MIILSDVIQGQKKKNLNCFSSLLFERETTPLLSLYCAASELCGVDMSLYCEMIKNVNP